MIAFGSAMSDPEAYARYAKPGIDRTREPSSEVFAFQAAGTVCRSYNLVLDAAAALDDLEALVLVAQAVEIVDPEFLVKVRAALAQPGVGLVGALGATGVTSIAWWEGEVSAAPVTVRYPEHGGGEARAFAWRGPGPAPAEVDSLDGLLLALSPEVVRNLRFDESLTFEHGYDLDYCLQAREAGHRITTADLRLVHHRELELFEEEELKLWIEGHVMCAEKWQGRMPGDDGRETDWKRRARRAEAEKDVACTIAYSNSSRLNVQVHRLERDLERMTRTFSWRATKPLRHLNRRRRERDRPRRR